MMITMRAACLRSCSLSVLLIIGGATLALAQNDPDTSPAAMTMFPHPGDSRWWLSGQVNLIWQTHGQFTSPYQGDNSLRPEPEQALSSVWTIYAGVRLPGHMELLLDIESAGGRGLIPLAERRERGRDDHQHERRSVRATGIARQHDLGELDRSAGGVIRVHARQEQIVRA